MNPESTKYKSTKQEKRVAKEIGGRTVVASGAIDFFKGDVRSEDYLVECKTTAKDYYVLNLTTWLKIQREALRDGMREPIMCIDLLDGEKRFAVVDMDSFTEYVIWLPKSHKVSNYKCTVKRSVKISSDCADEKKSGIVTFSNIFVLEGVPIREVNLLVTPWNLLLQFFKDKVDE